MPSARSATALPRAARAAGRERARPRRTPARRQPLRIRWDRVGRIGLLVVLVVVAGLYVKQGLSYLAARSQADQQLAIVHRLTRENARLEAQRRVLNDPATIERDARALGMVKPGERSYVITGLRNR